MAKHLTSILFLLFALNGFTQIKQVKMSIYFDLDKSAIRKDASKTLNELVDSIQKLQIVKIVVRGNTDSQGDSLYNIALSDKRTQNVIDFMVKKKFDAKLFTKEYFGEDKPVASNNSDENKQKNRRVDIIVTYKQRPKPEVMEVPVTKPEPEKPKVPDPVAKVNPCKEDTTIILPKGSVFTMNKCEYLERKDCLNFIEINTSQDVRANNLNTMDDSGDPLISGGMIDFSAKPGCGKAGEACFRKPLVIRIPVPEAVREESDFGVYLSRETGWNLTGAPLKRVEENGIQYFEFSLKCPGRINMDKKACNGRKIRSCGRTTIKIPRKYRIVSVEVVSDKPLSVYQYESNNKRQNKVKKIGVPCFFGSNDLFVIAVNKKTGDTVIQSQVRELNSYRRRHWFGKCKPGGGIDTWKVIIPFRNRGTYRKYIVKKKELVIGSPEFKPQTSRSQRVRKTN